MSKTEEQCCPCEKSKQEGKRHYTPGDDPRYIFFFFVISTKEKFVYNNFLSFV